MQKKILVFSLFAFLLACAPQLKDLPVDSDTAERSFIYGKVTCDISGASGLNLNFKHQESGKTFAFSKNWFYLPFKTKEYDFVLEVEPGHYTLQNVNMTQSGQRVIVLYSKSFMVEKGKGVYLGALKFSVQRRGSFLTMPQFLQIVDEKQAQDEVLKNTYPKIDLANTVSAL